MFRDVRAESARRFFNAFIYFRDTLRLSAMITFGNLAADVTADAGRFSTVEAPDVVQ